MGWKVLLRRMKLSPKVFMARTPVPAFCATGMTSLVKERKCASMTLTGICTVSNLKPCFCGDLEHAEVDGGVLVAGEADVADLACWRASIAAWMAPSSAKMRSGSSMRMTRGTGRDRGGRRRGGPWTLRAACCRTSRASVDLGHDEDLVAMASLESFAHADFADAVVVVPGVVEEGDAAIHGLVDEADHLVLRGVRIFGEVVSAHADGGDALRRLCRVRGRSCRETSGRLTGELCRGLAAPGPRRCGRGGGGDPGCGGGFEEVSAFHGGTPSVFG